MVDVITLGKAFCGTGETKLSMSATGSILHVCTLGNREGKIERRKKRKRKERKRAGQPTGEAIRDRGHEAKGRI